MKILLLADQESPYLWDYYKPGCLKDIDLMISCGDLKPEYLSFLVTMGRAPLFYVRGNHDSNYDIKPPEGCDCIDGEFVTYMGLRILGLGGSYKYNGGPDQYTEREMRRKLFWKNQKIKRAGGIDLLVTHAPSAGYGDCDDIAHHGFETFNDIIEAYHPKFHVHGHVHMNYGHKIQRTLQHGDTTVINAWERYIIEI